MHTALRLGVRVAEEVRRINPRSHICFYGLYASLNADYLPGTVADSVIGASSRQRWGPSSRPSGEIARGRSRGSTGRASPRAPSSNGCSFRSPAGVG